MKSKECTKYKEVKRATNYKRTRKGLLTAIYAHQTASSKARGFPPPSYTKEEFNTWLFSQSNFETLYKNWVDSGYLKDLRPSVDRKNDYEGYSIGNIQLMTWKENRDKLSRDILSGVHKKKFKAVIGTDNVTGKEFEFESMKEASRITGAAPSKISGICNNHKWRVSSGGYKWRFKN